MFGIQAIDDKQPIVGITCDSRRIRDGYVFVCISGEKDSGYRYVREAEARGAVAIIADRVIDSKLPVVLYKNPRRKMAECARKIYSYPDKKMYVLGVTGTNGKTTVTHLLRDIFEKNEEKTALIGTNGCYLNHFQTDESFTTSTTPEAPELFSILKNMNELGAQNAVMEVSSHSLAMDRVYGMKFDMAAFTNLSHDHLDFHKNIENYFMAKENLFRVAKKCVINIDDKYGQLLYEKYKDKSVSVGIDGGDICANSIKYTKNGTEFIINDFGNEFGVKLSQIGKFSVYNALCAYAAARCSKVNPSVIITALEESEGVKGRLENVPIDRDFQIIIDYAHSPDGLINVINALKEVCDGRIITLFGCGGNRDKSKRYEMGKISGELSDYTIITTDNPRFENPVKILKDIEKGIVDVTDNYTVIPNRFDAIGYAIKMAEKNDIVLLSGKGHENYIEEKDKKIHFDEREVIKYWTE